MQSREREQDVARLNLGPETGGRGRELLLGAEAGREPEVARIMDPGRRERPHEDEQAERRGLSGSARPVEQTSRAHSDRRRPQRQRIDQVPWREIW